jgi:hypothetical protein
MLAYIKGGVGATHSSFIYVVLLDNYMTSFGSKQNYASRADCLSALNQDYPGAQLVAQKVMTDEMKRRVQLRDQELAEHRDLVEQWRQSKPEFKPTYQSRLPADKVIS